MARFTAAEEGLIFSEILQEIGHFFARSVDEFGLPLRVSAEVNRTFSLSIVHANVAEVLGLSMTYTAPTLWHSRGSFFIARLYWPQKTQELTT